MPGSVALKALIVWAGILVLAVANGALREAVFLPGFGPPVALILSGLLLSVLIVCVAYLSIPWLGTRQPRHLLAIGAGWLFLTLVFEFSLGLWQGKTWAVLLEAYRFQDGNLWPLVLAVTALAPLVAGRLRGWV